MKTRKFSRQKSFPPKRSCKVAEFPRQLHIGIEVWTWRYGRTIRIKSPAGVTHWVGHAELLGITDADLFRARRQGYQYLFAVTPAMVKHYIERRLR